MKTDARHWNWEEAFDKFGFQDGDGEVFTDQVAGVLERRGFECTLFCFGLHNTVIESVHKNGQSCIPEGQVMVGHDDPRDYLPRSIVELLDAELPSV